MTIPQIPLLYYDNSPPLKIVNMSYIQECTKFGFVVRNKTCNLIFLYRLASQTKDLGFNLELILDKTSG